MTETEQIKAGYVSRVTEYVNPIDNLRKTGKFNLTDEEINEQRRRIEEENAKNSQ